MLVVVVILLVGYINRVVVADDQCFSYEFESPFFPGISCEDIYNKNPQSRNKSGYYWITDGPSNVYCGMNYTGLSCEHIYNNNRETADNNGYYPINNNQWTFCNMTAIAAGLFTFSCAGVGGEWRRIVIFDANAGDGIVLLDGAKVSFNGVSSNCCYIIYTYIYIHTRVETESGHPGHPGHILSGSSGSDPLHELSGSDPDPTLNHVC